MLDDVQPDLRLLLNCESLDIDVREEWSAQTSNHRGLIRQALGARYGEDFSALDVRPKPKSENVSISHCRSLGGFACCANHFSIGFDVEELARVREQVIVRVSTVAERREAPSLGALWTAKEAAFKALSDHLELISDVVITGWKVRDSISTFKVSNPQTTREDGQGVVFTQGSILFALFLKPHAD